MSTATPSLNGLVLAGGHSTRMMVDKGLRSYMNMPRREYCCTMLSQVCHEVSISCRKSQITTSEYQIIVDAFENLGPISGILSAMDTNRNVAWLVFACDLYKITIKEIEYLVAHRDPTKYATAFFNNETKRPEPFLTIWEPHVYSILIECMQKKWTGLSYVLASLDCCLLSLQNTRILESVNSPEDFHISEFLHTQIKQEIVS